MGWRDAPLADDAAPAPRWASAPLVKEEPPPTAPEGPGLLERAKHVAGGMLLPTKGSPLGEVLSAVTGGASERYNAPGVYSDPPAVSARREGESDRDYAVRTFNEEIRNPEGVARMATLGGITGGVRSGAATFTKPPRVATTPEAQILLKEGIDLPAGYRAGHNSPIAQLEAASADNWLGMAPEREAVKEQFMRVAQNKGVAPGAQVPKATDLQARLAELFDGFGPAYDAVRSKPVPSQALDTLPDAALMPTRGFDPRTAAGVKAEVENALGILGPGYVQPKPAHAHGGAPSAAPQAPTLFGPNGQPLPPPAPPPAPPKVATVGDVLKVRSHLREEARIARRSQNFDRLRLIENAEDVVTDALEQSLSPAERAHLQATDRQYARLMTAASASPAGQTGFTPLQYLKQVERGAGRRTFKTGGAGDLQDLGEAARGALVDAKYTGGRVAQLAQAPGLKYAAAPLARLANTSAGKRFLFEPRTTHLGPRAGPTPMDQALLGSTRAPMMEAYAANERPREREDLASLAPRVGRFGPALSAALARGPEAAAAAHFLLWNNEPEYRQAVEAAGEEP